MENHFEGKKGVLVKSVTLGILMILLCYAFVPMLATTVLGQEEEIKREECYIKGYDPPIPPVIENFNTLSPTVIGAAVLSAMREHMFYYNIYNDTLIPWLATGYEYSDDYKKLTFHLREGAEWSDGTPITADDYVFTMKMMKDDPAVSGVKFDYTNIIQSFSALDDYTFVLEFLTPQPHIVNDFIIHWCTAAFYPLPEHIYGPATTSGTGDVAPSIFLNPEHIYSGPYDFYQATEDSIIFRRNDDWWGAKIDFYPLPEPKWVIKKYQQYDQGVLALENNEIDAIRATEFTTIETLRTQNEDCYLIRTLDPCPRVLMVNNERYPWNIPEVRWAVAHAINQSQLLLTIHGKAGVGDTALTFQTGLYQGEGIPTDWIRTATESFVGENGQTVTYSLDPSLYDPEMSEEILEGLGWTKNQDGWWVTDNGTKVELTLYNMKLGIPARIAVAMSIGEMLREFGFDTVVRAGAWAEVGQIQRTGAFDMIVIWYCGSVVNPVIGASSLISSRIPYPNYIRYSNPEFDALVQEASVTSATDPRFATILSDMFKVYIRDLPCIPFYQKLNMKMQNEHYWTNWPQGQFPGDGYASPTGWSGYDVDDCPNDILVFLQLKSTYEEQAEGGMDPMLVGAAVAAAAIVIVIVVYWVLRKR